MPQAGWPGILTAGELSTRRFQEAPMPMTYEHEFIPAAAVPRARVPLLQHLVDTYASETSKTAAVWSELADAQLEFRPHARSSSVRQILVHQILTRAPLLRRVRRARRARRRGAAAPGRSPGRRRLRRAARWRWPAPGWCRWPRATRPSGSRKCRSSTSGGSGSGWSGGASSTRRTIVRRSALRSGCSRIAFQPTYGPTADVTWTGADPTTTLDAARRRGA